MQGSVDGEHKPSQFRALQLPMRGFVRACAFCRIEFGFSVWFWEDLGFRD